MVIGQSRAEHHRYMNMTDDEWSEATGKPQSKRSLQVPYFTPVKSSHGKALLDIADSCPSAVYPPIVHEYCALQMFKTRLEKDR
jgi:hypothetical protein